MLPALGPVVVVGASLILVLLCIVVILPVLEARNVTMNKGRMIWLSKM